MAWFGKFFKRKDKTVFVDLSGMAVSDAEYNRIKQQQEAYAMRLLQKLGKEGRESLTKDEMEFLDTYSKSSYLN